MRVVWNCLEEPQLCRMCTMWSLEHTGTWSQACHGSRTHSYVTHLYLLSQRNDLLILDNVQDLAWIATETAHASRSHAMDARIWKQPLHTTGGLSTAKASMSTGENKIFITTECCIKSAVKKDQKTTDPDCGQWGKPWVKEAYLSGMMLQLCLISFSVLIILFIWLW